MKIAALDMGSNTFLMIIAEVTKKGDQYFFEKVYRDELRVVRLAQGVHATRSFHTDALKRARVCLGEYRKIIDEEKVEHIQAVATSAARDASNRGEFFKITEEFKIPVSVIEGKKEAELTFLGATYDSENTEGAAVIDVGGGSTEVVCSIGGKLEAVSLNVGSVRLTELFFPKHPVDEESLVKCKEYILSEIEKSRSNWPKNKPTEIIAVAGTPTTLVSIMLGQPYESERVHGKRITIEEMQAWLTKLAKMSVPERKALPGMDAHRADVIVAGMQILISVCEGLGGDKITVSDKGVRYGLAIQMHAKLG